MLPYCLRDEEHIKRQINRVSSSAVVHSVEKAHLRGCSPFFLSLQKFPKVGLPDSKEEAEHERQIASATLLPVTH